MVFLGQGKPITAWIIGLIVIAVVEIYLAYVFFGAACSAPAIAQLMVLVALPAVYVGLMYLTLKGGR